MFPMERRVQGGVVPSARGAFCWYFQSLEQCAGVCICVRSLCVFMCLFSLNDAV